MGTKLLVSEGSMQDLFSYIDDKESNLTYDDIIALLYQHRYEGRVEVPELSNYLDLEC